MDVAFQADPEALVTVAWPTIVADEVGHTGVLGVLEAARRAHAAGLRYDDRPWRSAVVRDTGGVVAAGIAGRGGVWLVTGGPEGALLALGHAAHDGASAVAGVAGPAGAARAFAAGSGVPMHVHFRQPVMRLAGDPQPGPAVCGRCRVAGPDDADLLLAWFDAFRIEARLTDPPERLRADVAHAVAARRMLLWTDAQGTPVSMAGARRVEPTAARIGPVYTPPARRGRGYARAVVEEGCRRLLAEGARQVLLFTDAANPTSNALYARIGFTTVTEQLMLVADAPA